MIEWIVTSSALILLVIILRVIIKDRVSPRLRYTLWGLVLLRLLIPGTLWESRASVMTPVAAQERYQAVERIPRYVQAQPGGRVEIGHPDSGNLTSIPPEAETVRTDQPAPYQKYDPEEAVSLTEPERRAGIRDVFLIAWLAGIAAAGGFLLAVNLKFNRGLRKKRRTLERYRGRWVFVMEGLASPCLFGLFRPAVYLTPEVAEKETAKAHVLAHEYAHFRQGDHIWAALRGVCLAVHWYNPLVWLAAYLSRRDCELSCDEGAVRLLGEESRADYGRTLVGLVARRTTPKDLACCATTMTGGKSALKERIALLVKRPRTTAWMACIVVAACIVFAVCTFTGAAVEEPDAETPETEPGEVLPEDDGLPNVEDLPTDIDWDAPIWLLRRVEREEIYVYQDPETGVNYLRRGDYLQKLETRNMYDQQGYNDMALTYRDLDGDDEEELAIVYHITSESGAESRELLVCDWDGQRWTERHPEGIVPALVRDFRDNYEVSEIWSDPGMGETPGPSILSVNWDGMPAAFEVSPWLLKTGGTLVSALDEQRYAYYIGADGIDLVIYGEASYADSPVEDSRQLWYACPVVCRTDGTFAAGPGALNTSPPEDLPTERMDLSRPAEEQGPWLLLAQTPGFDIALYRNAWDDQHVYLRVTNGSFQAFDQDLNGMELLPTMEVVDGEADLTVRVLYRRYEGTYFNGTSYEPGVVAEQVFYDWDDSARYWTEWTISTQPAQRLTEDRPALADLPVRVVSPGTPAAEADMWLVGELPEQGISAYYEQSTGKTWLRYGDSIQSVEGMAVCLPQMLLPELYWTDLDGDGNRELAAISTIGHGTGISVQELTVYEWDGQRWTWTTDDNPSWIIEDFNRQRNYAFYEDGTAFISYNGLDLLLDLSLLWESDYWGGAAPDICELSQYQINYTYEDGQLVLTLAGELLHDGSPFLRGYAFECVWHVSYYSGSLTGYRGTLTAGRIDELRSGFAIEPQPPELTDTWRAVLAEIWDKCEKNGENVFAVHDVNGDGEDELIVRWTLEGSPNYGWGTTVYDTNGKAKFSGNGRLTFYSNGAISVPWSHNQGPATAIWPYDLYTCRSYAYNGTNYSIYTEVGSARARCDSVPGFEDVAYADLDGDGMVYYIGEYAYKEENLVDNAVYEAWRDRYLAGAQVLPVQYFSLTEENISK